MAHTVSHSSDYGAARGLLGTGIKSIGASALPDEFHVPSVGRLTGRCIRRQVLTSWHIGRFRWTYRCTILRQVGHERFHMTVLTGLWACARFDGETLKH